MVLEKSTLRREMRAQRNLLTPEQRANAGEAVARLLAFFFRYRSAASVLVYIDTDGEVPTSQIIETARANGKTVFLPRLENNSLSFSAFEIDGGLCDGSFGIPVSNGRPFDPERDGPALVLAPLVAWDGTGTRLGRGGGHYDRFLAGPGQFCSTAGIAFEFQQCARVPRDPWDVPLRYVVTERRIVRCGTRPRTVLKLGKDGSQDGSQLNHGRRSAGCRSRVGA